MMNRKNALRIVGGIVGAAVAVYSGLVLYVSVYLACAMRGLCIDDRAKQP